MLSNPHTVFSRGTKKLCSTDWPALEPAPITAISIPANTDPIAAKRLDIGSYNPIRHNCNYPPQARWAAGKKAKYSCQADCLECPDLLSLPAVGMEWKNEKYSCRAGWRNRLDRNGQG